MVLRSRESRCSGLGRWKLGRMSRQRLSLVIHFDKYRYLCDLVFRFVNVRAVKMNLMFGVWTRQFGSYLSIVT